MIFLGWVLSVRGSTFEGQLGGFYSYFLKEPLVRASEFEHPGLHQASGKSAGEWLPAELGVEGPGLSAAAFADYSQGDSAKDKLIGLRLSAERDQWGLDATASEFSYSQMVAGRWLKWASDTRLILLGLRRNLDGAWFGLASGVLVPVEGSVLLPLRAYARGSWWAASLTGLALTSDRRSLLSLSADTGGLWARVDLSFGGDTLWAAARAGLRKRWGTLGAAAVRGNSLEFSAFLAPVLRVGSERWFALEPRLWFGSWGSRWALGAFGGVNWLSGGLMYDSQRGLGAGWEVRKCF